MLYFQQNSSVDPGGYEELQNYPSGLNQEDDNVTITSAMGPVLVDTYITPIGAMAEVTTLRKGLRIFNSYDYVSSASGITQINFTAFQRFSNGTEKVFYSQLSEDINALVPTVYVTNRVSQTDLQVNPTDRLGIKVYAQTTHPSPITVHFLYMGQTNVSHFMSGYFDCTQPIPAPEIPNYPAQHASAHSIWTDIQDKFWVDMLLNVFFWGFLILVFRVFT